MPPVVSVKDLWFKYSASEDWILKDLNLVVEEGETVVIMGPSGCGKSTLLYTLVGMIPHMISGVIRGNVEVLGMDIQTTSPLELSRRVSFVFQNPELQVIMPTVIEELVFGLENIALDREEIRRRVDDILGFIGFRGREFEDTRSLNPGDKQVLAIASALALKPKILLLDEPTSMLDHKGTARILGLAERLKREMNLTLIIAEHRIEWIAEHADRIIIMRDGEIVKSGAPKEVFRDVKTVSEVGVRPPQVSEIFYRLGERSPELGRRIPITLGEALEIVSNMKASLRSPDTTPGIALEAGHGLDVVVSVRDLWFRYGKNLPWVLRGVSLEVYKGEFLAIIGHSGAGKTTLVKHFNGLLKPLRGEVVVAGRDTRKTPMSKLSRVVGMVMQNPDSQFFASTIYEEVSFALRKMGLDRREIESRISEAFKSVDLAKPLNLPPHLLSFGEKHRLAIASILAMRPRVLILDEPFSGLDYKRSLQLLKALKRYVTEGNTVVLVAHDLQLISEVADRVVVLEEGTITRTGSMREVLSDSEWLEEHGFVPLQSTLLARAINLRGVVTISELSEVLLNTLS